MPGPKERNLALVVLNWNGRERSLRCLASIERVLGRACSVFFVDNGSTDGSAGAVRSAQPWVHLVENGENLGFAGGMNRGIELALVSGAEVVGVLNNDLVVVEGFVEPLVAALATGGSAAGPKILELGREGRVWSAGGRLGFAPNLSRLRGHGRPDGADYDTPDEPDYLPGCALFASAEVWREVGTFDTRYFAYLEDVDWCLRARAAGVRLRYVPASVVRHVGSESTGGGYSPTRKYLNAANTVRFLRDHGTWRTWAAFVVLDCLCLPLVFVAGLANGRWRGALSKARGILDGIRGRVAVPPALRRGVSL